MLINGCSTSGISTAGSPASSCFQEGVTLMCVKSFQLLFTTVFFNCRDSYGFITYRYTCDAFAALENGYTLRRSNEPDFELYFCGRKQFYKSNYADLGRCFALCELKYVTETL